MTMPMVRVEYIVHDPKGSALCLQPWPLYGIVIANTTLLLLLCWLLYVDKYIENYYNKGGPDIGD